MITKTDFQITVLRLDSLTLLLTYPSLFDHHLVFASGRAQKRDSLEHILITMVDMFVETDWQIF